MLLNKLENALEIIIPPTCKSFCGQIAELQRELEPEEYKLSPEASPARYAEFVAGRNCLKEAVKKVSPTKPTIGRTDDGKPIPPCGLTGSISHKYPYVVALAGLKTEVKSIGVDIERVDTWNTQTASVFSLSRDFSCFANLNLPFHVFSSILFSVKESTFKALSVISDADAITLKTISPTISSVTNNIYQFSVTLAAHQCSGRAVIIDKNWVIAVAWIC
ncbi:4'-phosphopantetheinyl transferase superfamily protein [Pseudoalteromonas sp. JC3]|uniref:4'-phosphopantetheinyl transferase family protein n=1 Tax=Pseudoalteromonas sp. JC3 TaxID=2810196 RepID=UPI0019D1E896|nr:4'-phosphopantetheinyl transferase superfamily protein [Pseudoalteromonas sp. JC3]MBR8843162.1 4'-phosphopantetheinyl transferase superfamily protein [Pseudoalteromonas sp. JC3]WJE09280.1 4'-phosphopantetheinyl transferase superfamily protein [Pseudoalteromonas sp. JC3]